MFFHIPSDSRPGRRLVAVLAAFVSLSSIAAAQTQAQAVEDVRRNARVHAGPLYATPVVQLTELGVDGNVFNAAGDQKSDFTFTLTPRADLWIPMARRGLLQSTVGADLVYYANYASERSVDPQFAVRGEAYLNRLTLFASNAFVNTRQRPNYEIDIRSRHLENNLQAGADVRLSPRVSVEISGRRFDTKYDADALFDKTYLQHTLNRKTTGVQLTARHRLTPLTTLALRYENLADRFEFAPARDADSYRVMPGVEFKPRALIKGSAYVGYRQFTPLHPGMLQEFGGLVAQLGLSYTLLGANSLGVTYRRDLTYSYEDLQPFFLDTAVGASARRAIGRRFDVLVSADRHNYAYRDMLINPVTLEAVAATEPRVDITWNYAASLGYHLGRAGRIGFGASYWQRESNTKSFRDYNKLRFGTTATYGF